MPDMIPRSPKGTSTYGEGRLSEAPIWRKWAGRRSQSGGGTGQASPRSPYSEYDEPASPFRRPLAYLRQRSERRQHMSELPDRLEEASYFLNRMWRVIKRIVPEHELQAIEQLLDEEERLQDTAISIPTTAVPPLDFDDLLDRFDTVLFDCDGVLWNIPDELVKPAMTTVNCLLHHEKRVMFITNNSNKSRLDFLAELQKKGVDFGERTEAERLGMMISAAYTTANYLKKEGYKRPFVLTSDLGLLEELRQVGIGERTDPDGDGYYATIDEIGVTRPEFESGSQDRSVGEALFGPGHFEDVDCIVVGWDAQLNARKVAAAVNYVAWADDAIEAARNASVGSSLLHTGLKSLPIIACSGDSGGVFGTVGKKVTRKVRAIGNGAMADIIARSFDPPKTWLDMGKPSDHLLEIMKDPQGPYKIVPPKTLMVGDTLATDIVFGNKGGMKTLLVLSGVTTKADVEHAQKAVHEGAIESVDWKRAKLRVPQYLMDSVAAYADTSDTVKQWAQAELSVLAVERSLSKRRPSNPPHAPPSLAAATGAAVASVSAAAVASVSAAASDLLKSAAASDLLKEFGAAAQARDDELETIANQGAQDRRRTSLRFPEDGRRSDMSDDMTDDKRKMMVLKKSSSEASALGRGVSTFAPISKTSAPPKMLRHERSPSVNAIEMLRSKPILTIKEKLKLAEAERDEEKRTRQLQKKRRELMRARFKFEALNVDIMNSYSKSRQSSRAAYLKTLVEEIGQPPVRSWGNEWVQLNVEFYRIVKEGGLATEGYVREHNKLKDWVEVRRPRINQMVQRGWSVEAAEAYMALNGRAAAMAEAMRDTNPETRARYAASTFALSNALFETAQREARARKVEYRKILRDRKTKAKAEAAREARKAQLGAAAAAAGGSPGEPGAPSPSALDFAPSPADAAVPAPSEARSRASSGTAPEAAPAQQEPPNVIEAISSTIGSLFGAGTDAASEEAVPPLAPTRARSSTRKQSVNLADLTEELLTAEEKKRINLPPMLYWHRSGEYGLEQMDPEWRQIEDVDEHGFRGLTSRAMVKGTRNKKDWTNDRGYTMTKQFVHTEPMPVTHMCDVIGFESHMADDTGMHAAVETEPNAGAFPPLTLFRLKKIFEPGEWSPIPESDYVYPARDEHGIPHPLAGTKLKDLRPRQRLLVMTATYRQPTAGVQESKIGKLFGSTITLEYANREAYVRGLGAEFSRPIMTMEEEFGRELSWTDWKGAEYNLKECYSYVKGPAKIKGNCTAGTRDEKNDSLKPEDFLSKVNDFIKERRNPHGPKPAHQVNLPEEAALLTLDEVLAVRLYSGPAFQPINEFLRQISKVKGEFRTELVRCPKLTFAATVNHICDAIRKLADVNTMEELEMPLYRAVRGELPNSFWASDELDLVSAVDTAFMSTSRDKTASKAYMDKNSKNVLWVLQPKPQSDSAFHCGASIRMLSQFENEDEVLFPTCTMIKLTLKGENITRSYAPREPIIDESARLEVPPSRNVSDRTVASSRASRAADADESVGGGEAQPPSPMWTARWSSPSRPSESLGTRSADPTALPSEDDAVLEWRKARMSRFEVESYEMEENLPGSWLEVRAVPAFV